MKRLRLVEYVNRHEEVHRKEESDESYDEIEKIFEKFFHWQSKNYRTYMSDGTHKTYKVTKLRKIFQITLIFAFYFLNIG